MRHRRFLVIFISIIAPTDIEWRNKTAYLSVRILKSICVKWGLQKDMLA
jgi:hypothetical protein